jgi:hypothetical protein
MEMHAHDNVLLFLNLVNVLSTIWLYADFLVTCGLISFWYIVEYLFTI